MRRSRVFKSFVYVLVLSLLNLQFSSIAYGVKGGRTAPLGSVDGEGYGEKAGIALRESISAKDVPGQDTDDTPLENVVKNTSQVHPSSPSFITSQELDPKFAAALSSFREKHREDAERDSKTSTAIYITAGITALFATAALAFLFLNDATTAIFLRDPVDDDPGYLHVPPYPKSSIIGASCAGFLSFLDNYLLLEKTFKGGFSTSKHQVMAE